MALFAQLAVIRLKAEAMMQVAERQNAALARLQKRSGNVSDKDTVNAICDLNEVVVSLGNVVKSIYEALQHLDKESRGR